MIPRIVMAWLLVVCCAAPSPTDDWPQWMGPKRDNVWRETRLLERFPERGPTVVWRAPVAGGYAGPAVVGGRLFVTDYVTQDDVKVENFERKESTGAERVLCLDAQTGDEVWKHEYPVKYTISYPERGTGGGSSGKLTGGREGSAAGIRGETQGLG